LAEEYKANTEKLNAYPPDFKPYGETVAEPRKIEAQAQIAEPPTTLPIDRLANAILIFTKGGETEKVWFYDMQSDGYSLDDKRTKLEGYGDLQDIVAQYKKRDTKVEIDRKAKFFFVPKAEIVAEGYDLSMSRYKEDVFEEVVYEKPAVILAKIKTMEGEIIGELQELEGMLV